MDRRPTRQPMEAPGSNGGCSWRTTTPRGGCSTPRRSPGRCARDSSPAPRRRRTGTGAPDLGRRRLPFGGRRRRRRAPRTYRPTPTAAGSSSTICSRAWACTRRRTRLRARRRLRRGCSGTGAPRPPPSSPSRASSSTTSSTPAYPPTAPPRGSRGTSACTRGSSSRRDARRCSTTASGRSRSSWRAPCSSERLTPVCPSDSSRRSPRGGNRRMRSPSPGLGGATSPRGLRV
mmetsp:Transcript_12135/g.51049  ORF Transcript_12135/g.51049 Transcript_12135/m.51049 type:complete len:232 (+) Transcript_12135:717-1412(+)